MPKCRMFPLASRRRRGFLRHPPRTEALALPGLRQAILRLDGGHSLHALRALPPLRELRFAAYCARARRCRHADLSETLSWLFPVSLRPLPPEILQHSAAPENRSVHDWRRLTEDSRGLIAPPTRTRATRK